MTDRNTSHSRIDWADLHRRLDGLRRVLEGDGGFDPARVAAILKRRSAALAAVPPAQTVGAPMEIIEFLLAGERYGVDTAFVREVCPLLELTPVPCTPSYVLGIIDVRGEFVSVVDIRKFFDLVDQRLSDLNKVIVLATDGIAFGILADAILAVDIVDRAQLQDPLTAGRGEYLLGITAEHVAIIDARRLLADRALIVDDAVME